VTASAHGPYSQGLDKNAANYTALTPLTFLDWAAHTAPDRAAIVHGALRRTWRETYARCRRLASALRARGVGPGDTVALMLLNTPEMYECQFGVPMSGAVLNTLNARLDAPTIAFMLDHGEAKVLVTDREFSPVIEAALALVASRPLVIDVDDVEYAGPGERLGALDYEALLASGDPDFAWHRPTDEWDPIALNYTSGTTGDPKGVVFHHRGAYLNALGEILAWGIPRFSVYLWTVPMFHCNGWCMPWTMAALAGTNVCLRKVETHAIFRLIKAHGVTHYGGAPIVHNTMLGAPDELWEGVPRGLKGYIAGAAPPAATIEAMEQRGVEITHVYGLTEVYGPATSCVKQPEWEELPMRERAIRNGRQGMRFVVEEEVKILDPDTMQPVPADGETIGEIMFRGNITMKGYLKNPTATAAAFAGGWFHSGDLAVLHPDGYMKVKDRGKDIIISGGENISSLEVEDVLHRHPAVFAAAVVAQPDKKWGERPRAYVELKPDATATEAELIAHCREGMAHFKAPDTVVFGPLPKTSTGKIQKFVLRERARSADAIE
jgi:fatty-acyl-CoA synthase